MKTDQAFARETDPITSHEAAASIGQEQIRITQKVIVDLLNRFGPMTHQQLVHHSSYITYPCQSESGIRTRCKELVRMGKVRDSGQRQVLSSGRKSIVWEAV